MMQMCEWTFHENKLMPTNAAQVPVASHVINFGTGVFESLRTYGTENGVVIKGLNQHIERLRNSLMTINLPPVEREFVQQALYSFIHKNKINDGYIRILAYPNGLCNVLDTINFNTQISIIGWHLHSARSYGAIKLHISQLRRPNASATLSRAKVCGLYVIDAVVQNNAAYAGYDTGLLLNEDGTICEAAGANIFMIKNQTLYTPVVNNSINGITAKLLLAIAQFLGIQSQTTPLILEDLLFADEAFITGTFYGIRPINAVERFTIKSAPGQITKALIAELEKTINGENRLSHQWMNKINEENLQTIN